MAAAFRRNGNHEWIIQSKHPVIKIGLPIAAIITLAITLSGWIFSAGSRRQAYDDTVGKVSILEESVSNLDIRVTGIEHDLKPLENIPEQLRVVQNNQREVLTDLKWIKEKLK